MPVIFKMNIWEFSLALAKGFFFNFVELMFCCITLAVLISSKYITGIYRMVIILRKMIWDKQEKRVRKIEEEI